MDVTVFFELLVREANDEPVGDDIIRAIELNPGIVMTAYTTSWRGRGKDLDRIRWLWAFNLAGFTHNYEPAEPPKDQPLFLYRGSSDTRKLSMSWSQDYGVAHFYATRNASLKSYQGNIYAHWAWRDEILGTIEREEWLEPWPGMGYNPRQKGRYVLAQFNEYVLDWRALTDENVHLLEVHPSNLARETARCRLSGRAVNFTVLR
ncbi:hypothetical protein ACRU43_12865 [Mycobacterium colombiense]